MQSSFSEEIVLTLVISTVLLLLFATVIIYFMFHYQKKRHRHQQEVLQLQETFNQTLMQSKLEIQELTLDHIAKELHANLSHLVSLININLSEILPQAPESIRENVLETKSLTKQLMGEMKSLSASLNTDHILHIGLAKALVNELDRVAKTKRYQIQFSKKGEEFRLIPEYEIILFRLCQEVINNTVKYARAKVVSASLQYYPEYLCLTLSDDGVGFNQEIVELQSADKESTGLVNMQKRARLMNGTFAISSKEGEGTTVSIMIPIKK